MVENLQLKAFFEKITHEEIKAQEIKYGENRD